MSLQKLDIYSLRNIQRVSIEPSSGINLIIGENASGKSSLLEAIFILGRARSFRTNHLRQVIQFDKTEFIVSGHTLEDNGTAYHLGIQHNGKHCEIHINQEKAQKAELAYSLPVLLIHPKSYKLIDAGSQLRREFLDWGIFNNDENFLSCWRRFKKSLQQRNALLKTQQLNQIDVWDTELIEYGTIVSEYREFYLARLQPIFLEICHHFLNINNVTLQYLSGWDSRASYKQCLVTDLQKDARYGFTHSGPHRGDFSVRVNDRLAKDFVSRGQQKLLMLALKLAQVKLINCENNNSICVLIDDLTAELDVTNKIKLLKYLSNLNCQVFMSSTELTNFGDLGQINNYKAFHVERGEVGLAN